MLHLLADICLNHHLLTACHRRGAMVDILPARKAGIEGATHLEVLAHAATLERILVSHDIDGLPAAFEQFLDAGNTSPGVFLIDPLTPVSAVSEWLTNAASATEPHHWDNLILEIPFLRLLELPDAPEPKLALPPAL